MSKPNLCSISMKWAQSDTVSVFYITVSLPSDQMSWFQPQKKKKPQNVYIPVGVIRALQ